MAQLIKKENIYERLERLESYYRRSQIRHFLIAYPILMISLTVSLTALTALIALVLMPLLGEKISFLIGAILFIVCCSVIFSLHGNLIYRFLPSGDNHPVIIEFNKAFPVQKEEERELAIDILDKNFDKYEIAKLIVGSPSGINRDAFDLLLMDTGKKYIKKNEFVFQCDQRLLEKHNIRILKKYGDWFEAITTGKFKPKTQAQKRFLEVQKGLSVPITEPEKTWREYQNFVKWQWKIDSMDYSTLLEYRKSYLLLDKRYEYLSRRLKEGRELNSSDFGS